MKLNKLGHENAVILFKVMDGGSEYCYWSVLDPVQAMLNNIQFCLFKSLFLVCMCSIYGMCVCTYMSAVLEVRGQLYGVDFLLSPLYGSWGIKLRSSGFYGKYLT